MIYAIARVDLGQVYIGESVDPDRRIREHERDNTWALFSGQSPDIVYLEQVAKAEAPWEQLLWMRACLRDGWSVVSELGHNDAKHPLVARSPEWIARRRGMSPFGGRTPCAWTAAGEPHGARPANEQGTQVASPLARTAEQHNGTSHRSTRRGKVWRTSLLVLVLAALLAGAFTWRDTVETWIDSFPLGQTAMDTASSASDVASSPADGYVNVQIDSEHPLAPAIADAMTAWAGGISTGNYQASWDMYSQRHQDAGSFDEFSNGNATSSIPEMVIRSVNDAGDTDGASANIGFVSLQDPQYGRNGQSCSAWELTYDLVWERDSWRIDSAALNEGREPQAC